MDAAIEKWRADGSRELDDAFFQWAANRGGRQQRMQAAASSAVFSNPLASEADLQHLCMLAGRVIAYGPTLQYPYKCAAGFCEQEYPHTGYVSRKRRACEECWHLALDEGYNAHI